MNMGTNGVIMKKDGEKMITAVLFDLDGTLLPMDYEKFMKVYFGLLCKKLKTHGYEPSELIDAVWAGTGAMVKNDGSRHNEDVFWEKFSEILGDRVFDDRSLFDEFYDAEFNETKAACGQNRELVDLVHDLKRSGYRIVLATNPIFPSIATESRIRWAGLEPSDFEMYTTYENIGYSKPNPEYYREVLRRMDVRPEDAIMVGNDVDEDMVAAEIGAKVFLLTDCLLNKSGKDISVYPHGGVQELRKLLL